MTFLRGSSGDSSGEERSCEGVARNPRFTNMGEAGQSILSRSKKRG